MEILMSSDEQSGINQSWDMFNKWQPPPIIILKVIGSSCSNFKVVLLQIVCIDLVGIVI